MAAEENEIDQVDNTVDFIIAYEGGELDDDAIVEGFQAMINSGLVWQLQSRYGRQAMAMIEAGVCHPKGE